MVINVISCIQGDGLDILSKYKACAMIDCVYLKKQVKSFSSKKDYLSKKYQWFVRTKIKY